MRAAQFAWKPPQQNQADGGCGENASSHGRRRLHRQPSRRPPARKWRRRRHLDDVRVGTRTNLSDALRRGRPGGHPGDVVPSGRQLELAGRVRNANNDRVAEGQTRPAQLRRGRRGAPPLLRPRGRCRHDEPQDEEEAPRTAVARSLRVAWGRDSTERARRGPLAFGSL
jgi:hypothetical protein